MFITNGYPILILTRRRRQSSAPSKMMRTRSKSGSTPTWRSELPVFGGVLGAGINRMNIYVVRRATQGLANYILKQGKKDNRVAIAYDSRHMSPEFADESARVLAANGITAYKFESLRPTPELSFAVRELGCIAGINITASHNPPEYNGYKVYWEDGAQFTPPHDAGVTAEVLAIEDLSKVKTMTASDAMAAGLYKVIGADIDDKYIAALKKQIKNQDAIDKMQKDITIIYTPLHGTGNVPARRVLHELGFENVYVVPEQELPDGDFPTVGYPNPESSEAFELGMKMAKEKDADLVLATDPDADRLGCYVKDNNGEYHVLTGNMSGCLLCEYTLSQIAAKGGIPADGEVISSIVTTNMVAAIAKAYGAKFVEVLTGFKWIGREILRMEKEGKGTYLFGLEESYGCLIGTHARDKDAIVATMALCEAACYYKAAGQDHVGRHDRHVREIRLLLRQREVCHPGRNRRTGTDSEDPRNAPRRRSYHHRFLPGTLRKRLPDRRHQEPRHRRRDRDRPAGFRRSLL